METVDVIITDLKKLRKLSKPTTWEEIDKLDIINRLRAANETAWTKGVGLAAMQIGVYLRVAWFFHEGKEYTLVNPVITEASGPIINPQEGCLSLPNIWTATRRYHEITVKTLGREGMETLKFSGFPAIVVQHEVDHMNGVINTQRRYTPKKVAGRNDPCPCKSGKKYKKCCIDKLRQPEIILEVKDDQPKTECSPDSQERREDVRGVSSLC